MIKKCKVINCNNKYYAKGYCRKHYEGFISRGGYKKHKCLVDKCNNIVTDKNKYCRGHKYRIKKNLSLDLSVRIVNGPKGVINGNWRGGCSEYPNHYLMKKNRILKLKQAKGMCEICGFRGDRIHHIDKNKSNHLLKNLIVVCSKCHGILHRGQRRKSKYKELYGMTIAEMVNTFGKYVSYYYLLHTQGLLKKFITKPDFNNKISGKALQRFDRVDKYKKIYGHDRFKLSEMMETSSELIPLFHRKGKIRKFFKKKLDKKIF
ncbi:MAG: hypothetical protein PHQ91_15995 [Thermoanaerobaculaceae bacterium]|nr:hypothetical protein [Thermoanaerobaculaceae bacterium]